MSDAPKFTPGPWYVQRGEDGEALAVNKWVTGDNGGATAKTIARMTAPRTSWGHRNARITQSEIDANAHLIAAAPELYAVASAPLIYTVEESEDAIRLKIAGALIAAVPADSAAGVALLQFDAQQRAALARARGEA